MHKAPANPGAHFSFCELGEPGPDVRRDEFPGEIPHLPGELELPLGAHFSKEPGLKFPDDGINSFHALNLGRPAGTNKTGFRLPKSARRREQSWPRCGMSHSRLKLT